MLAAVAAGLPGVSRSRAQQLARHELARPMYKPSLAARIWHDIGHWLSSLAGTSATGSTSWVGPILVTVVIVAVLAALLYLAGPVRRTRRAGNGPVLQGHPLTAGEHRATADRLAAAGDYQAAIIERVRAIATELESRLVLPPRPGRTAAELAAEAGQAIPAEAALLTAAAGLFNDVRYGGRPGALPGYEQVRDLDLRVQAARVLVSAGLPGPSPAPVMPPETMPPGAVPPDAAGAPAERERAW